MFLKNIFQHSFEMARHILYGGIDIGWVSGIISISKSTSLSWGTTGISSLQTSQKILITQTYWIGVVSILESLTWTKW